MGKTKNGHYFDMCHKKKATSNLFAQSFICKFAGLHHKLVIDLVQLAGDGVQ
jgi:hypothetical protein